ncbi:COX11 protein, partial [Zapornia atra]|nr:COX11 protein [Zapornia atra]
VVPGETALAFYKAKNPTDKPIIGISTYNVIPFEAGQYFNKIQCFCFEEQWLNPQEEVDMPVFFYIDPEFVEDPKMAKVDLITLSYTFFEAKEGQKLPLPGFR